MIAERQAVDVRERLERELDARCAALGDGPLRLLLGVARALVVGQRVLELVGASDDDVATRRA